MVREVSAMLVAITTWGETQSKAVQKQFKTVQVQPIMNTGIKLDVSIKCKFTRTSKRRYFNTIIALLYGNIKEKRHQISAITKWQAESLCML